MMLSSLYLSNAAFTSPCSHIPSHTKDGGSSQAWGWHAGYFHDLKERLRARAVPGAVRLYVILPTRLASSDERRRKAQSLLKQWQKGHPALSARHRSPTAEPDTRTPQRTRLLLRQSKRRISHRRGTRRTQRSLWLPLTDKTNTTRSHVL